ncbi:hypothetical protein QEV83_07635 [Methylocapsa sp. D3K7]|uniref:hypothetical protein n=1 Tax=Methylocapsa sp. D3K7 TaxID=3041435 RepID=UPI00244E8B70|nr:hypothetical protein [Methylocapsa sp. D3K7]WGJ16105.1 hypothetical protein QEV83_07635 [Methylocapsa sp. D3K7]
MLCRFCEEDKKLINAHIIAECLLEPLKDPSGPMTLVSKDSYPKRLPKGRYDGKILCANCDNKFSPWEQYTANLLVRHGAYDQFRQAKPDKDFYTIQDYDYASLKLCLLSILWRMSISVHTPGVVLGPFEATIRRMLLDKNPGCTDEFPMFIYRLVGELDSSTLRPTVLSKDEGVNVYELGLPGYVAFIKVDKRPPPKPIRERVLARGKPLVIGVTHSPLTLAKISELLSVRVVSDVSNDRLKSRPGFCPSTHLFEEV